MCADHYHRVEEDVELMRELGVQAYRFSVAWPRVIPDGSGEVNEAGMAFYDRLVDQLLAAGIEPWVCLYHWDLPQALEHAGGWACRDVVSAFARYSRLVGERLADRVENWIVMNEAENFTIQGYFSGTHAPGRRGSVRTFMRALHHSNLAQAVGARELRAAGAKRVGSAFMVAPVHPASAKAKDVAAAKRADQLIHAAYMDPAMRGEYPPLLRRRHLAAAQIEPGDMAMLHEPLDFIGVNLYRRAVITRDLRVPVVRARHLDRIPGAEATGMGWEVRPCSLHEALMQMWRTYGVPLVVTENGAAYPDVVAEDGAVHDGDRIHYLARHIAQVHRAIGDGALIDGYLLWSLLDNFEWAEGLTKRFGIVYVDYPTQRRIVKDSARFYAGVIARNGLEGAPE